MRALITGATGGLGSALARHLSANKYQLILNGRDHVKLAEVRQQMPPESVSLVIGDIQDTHIQNTILNMAYHHENLDVVIHCAAIHRAGSSIDKTPSEELREVLATNLLAPILLTRKVYHLVKMRHGTFVFITSMAATQPGKGELAYAASKAGLQGFCKALRLEATNDRVRVLEVDLGGMASGMTASRSDQELLIHPDEAAAAIVAQLKDYSSLRTDTLQLRRLNYR